MNQALTVVAGVAVAVFGGSAVAGSRWLYRMFVQGVHLSMKDAITQTVQPQLTAVRDELVTSLDRLRSENRADHLAVAERLSALEDRVAAVEAQLTPTEENPQ